jgi:hypothetical protein
MTRALVSLLLFSAFLLALPQLGGTANILPDVEHGAEEGSIAVFLTTDLETYRKEIYFGETVWLAVQIKRTYSPCPFSLEIVDLETGGVVLNKSAVFYICGGRVAGNRYYMLIFPEFKIVDPVYEGRKYKITVRAGGERGAYTFTERNNPPGRITGITFFEGGRAATVLRQGGEYQLIVKVKNEGEVDTSYTLEYLANGRRLGAGRISVRPRAEATATYNVKLENLHGKVNFTIVLSGRIVNDAQSVFYDVTSPHPEFSLVYPPAVEGRVGDTLRVGIRLRNDGPTCQQPAVSVRADPDAEVSMNYGGGDVDYGGFLDINLSIRPLTAGRGNLTVVIRCDNYTSASRISYTALARLSASAVDQAGGSPPVKFLLDGNEITGEVWLAGGSHVLEALPEVRVGDARWIFERWSDGAATPSRRVNLTGNLEVRALYRLQYYIHFKTPWGTVEGWFDRGAEVETPGGDVLQEDWRYRFKGWSGSGCPASGKLVVLGPARCEAVYAREYRVVVKHFNGTETYWVKEGEPFRKEVCNETRGGVRLVPTGAEGCSWAEAPGCIVLSASGPAQCSVSWRKEYSVRIETGLSEGPPPWEGWLPEGSVIRYAEGDSLAPSKDGLSVAVVKGVGVRYRPAGWVCNGAGAAREVVVSAPLRCAGLWRKEVQVAVEVYLDGTFRERREFWVAQGDALRLSPSMLMPQASPLTPIKFTGWEGAPGAAGEDLLLKPETPVTVRARYYTDYTPLYAVVSAVAAAVAFGTFYYVRRRKEYTRVWATKRMGIEPVEETRSSS